MFEMFKEIEWDDYIQILSYGTPPIYIQLLIFVGLAAVWYVYRVVKRKRPLSKGNKVKYKIVFFLVILLILFQEAYDLRGLLETIGL